MITYRGHNIVYNGDLYYTVVNGRRLSFYDIGSAKRIIDKVA